MTELLTAAQMRSVEAAAINTGAVTGIALMERAGQGVVDAVCVHWPELGTGSHRAVVLCGPGGNGGDGYVVARLLQDRGWQVAVYALSEAVAPDAVSMRARWSGKVRQTSTLNRDGLNDETLVIDAMFGTGLTRDVAPEVAGLLALARSCRCRIVAVDILSGLCADSGRVRGPDVFDAAIDLTVTFQQPRVGHYLGRGAQLSGRLRVVPLGLDQQIDDLRQDGTTLVALNPAQTGRLAKVAGHKFGYGHALILSGGVGHGGAARLAARGALRIGAGLVTLGVPPAALIENACRLDAVMLRRIADAAKCQAVLQDGRINALCLGPGLGTGPREAALLAVALGVPPSQSLDREGDESRMGNRTPRMSEVLPLPLVGRGQGVETALRPTVLDADALTLLARTPALFDRLHSGCVLTPHAGEFARLFPDLAAQLAEPPRNAPAFSKVDATRMAARRAGCVVLFKGADTVIADPSGACSINSSAYDRAAPWLATAGSGDVLAGFITGLLARGFAPLQAAQTAAWLHVECARGFGPGLIAEDLPEELPKVFRAILS